jgi:Tol biopolymer transport system component
MAPDERHSSLVGQHLGVYQVLAPIGAGGMGEVYRARDTTLARDVAVKVLPPAVTADRDRLERFEREARLLAALNHPNIAHVYGFEKATGIPALVMELVEGPTLLDRIAKGPIPLDEALAIAKQLASALDAAHERGIVHRDLKPANIKVRADGTVKVLDFGLAKATGGDLEADLSQAVTAAGTFAGVLLGTPAYMSPEQARGQAVDKRTDIWAFGCVLLEMLTGRAAFARDTLSDTIAAILEREPDWQLPAPAASVRPLLQRCLEKDARNRLRDIGDAMALVDAATRAVDAAPASRARERWLGGIAAAAVISATALGAWIFSRPAAAPSELMRFAVPPPDGQRIAPGDAASGAIALSPDGRQIAFVAGPTPVQSMVFLRSLDSLTARPLPGTEGAAQLFWSPDGRYLGFAHAGSGGRGKLLKIAVSGGSPHELTDTGAGRAAWSPQGVILFVGPDRRLYTISETGGQPTRVTELDESRQEVLHNWPVFLPDGRRFIFHARSRTAANSALFLGSLDSPKRTHLVDALSSAEYGSGHLLFQRDGTLMAQPFDEKAGRIAGDAIPLVERVMYNGNSGRVAASVSSSGNLVYRRGASELSRLTWLDAGGRATGTVGAEGFYFDTTLSPDGRWIAVTRADQPSAPGDIWLIDVERGTPTKLTSDRADDNTPVWSPDARHIVFASNRRGQFDLYRRASGGAAADELLFESADDKLPSAFSPDGALLFFNRRLGPERRGDIWALPMSGGGQPFEVLGTPFIEGNASLSPDGRWMVYGSDDEGGQAFLQPYPPKGNRRVRLSTTGGLVPKWVAGGKQIVYVTIDRRFMAVDLTIAGGEIRPSPPRELFRHSIRRETPRLVKDYAVDATGQRFLVAAPTEEGDGESPLYVMLNWPASLRGKP